MNTNDKRMSVLLAAANRDAQRYRKLKAELDRRGYVIGALYSDIDV